MLIHPKEIEQKVFADARLAKGYAKKEVDAFLDIVQADYEVALAQVEHWKAEASRQAGLVASAQTVQFAAVAPGAASSVPVSMDLASAPHSAALLLQSAQKTADQIAAEAHAAADKVIEEAKLAAATIVADANTELANAGKKLDDLKATHAATAKLLQDALAALHFSEEKAK